MIGWFPWTDSEGLEERRCLRRLLSSNMSQRGPGRLGLPTSPLSGVPKMARIPARSRLKSYRTVRSAPLPVEEYLTPRSRDSQKHRIEWRESRPSPQGSSSGQDHHRQPEPHTPVLGPRPFRGRAMIMPYLTTPATNASPGRYARIIWARPRGVSVEAPGVARTTRNAAESSSGMGVAHGQYGDPSMS